MELIASKPITYYIFCSYQFYRKLSPNWSLSCKTCQVTSQSTISTVRYNRYSPIINIIVKRMIPNYFLDLFMRWKLGFYVVCRYSSEDKFPLMTSLSETYTTFGERDRLKLRIWTKDTRKRKHLLTKRISTFASSL